MYQRNWILTCDTVYWEYNRKTKILCGLNRIILCILKLNSTNKTIISSDNIPSRKHQVILPASCVYTEKIQTKNQIGKKKNWSIFLETATELYAHLNPNDFIIALNQQSTQIISSEFLLSTTINRLICGVIFGVEIGEVNNNQQRRAYHN